MTTIDVKHCPRDTDVLRVEAVYHRTRKCERWNEMQIHLLTDGSVNPKSGIGFGAYLAFPDTSEPLNIFSDRIKVRRFENTSSTKLELQTLLWALSEMTEREVVSYTDSQNIAGLLSRKERLIENGYCSKYGRLIRNHELYREFFKTIEKFDIQFRLISGYKPSKSKDRIDKIFSIVDRVSRNALRNYMKDKNNEHPAALDSRTAGDP